MAGGLVGVLLATSHGLGPAVLLLVLVVAAFWGLARWLTRPFRRSINVRRGLEILGAAWLAGRLIRRRRRG
jgi:apolipoprotein N-acyltransferase